MSNNNSSFASQLRRAQDISAILKGLEDYNPPNQEDSLAGFQAYIESLIAINDSETSLMKIYRMSVGLRNSKFFKDKDCAIKLMAAARTGIKMQYGKDSYELALLKTITGRMIASTAPKAADNTAENNAEENSVTKKPGRSGEKTYAAVTKNFNDFITTIEGFNSYRPATDVLKLENLKAKSQELSALNDEVAVNLERLQDAKKTRIRLYSELKERTESIKSFVRVKYKADSNIYQKVRSFRFR